MNTQKNEKERLKSQHQELLRLNRYLKQEFVGLDRVIDQITSKMSSWYLFPEKQSMPLVINLWGMTGTGKSDMVRKIVRFLKLETRFMQLDFAQESNRYSWENDFKEIVANNAQSPIIFCFDELQHLRSIGQSGNELGIKNYLWTLLDRGEIEVSCDYHALGTISALYKDLKLLETMPEVVVEKGMLVAGNEFYSKLNSPRISVGGDNDRIKFPFISRRFYDEILALMPEKPNIFELEKALKKMDKKESLEFLRKLVRRGVQPERISCKNALIFIAGNIDEAYPMAHSMDQNADADEFHKASLEIGVNDIKNALRARFRAEQISRLGHNHIVYPAFKEAHYRTLIDRRIESLKESIAKDWQLELVVKPSLKEAVYIEGVYPSQGTRPLWSCIQALIEGPAKEAIVHYQIEEALIDTLILSYDAEQEIIKGTGLGKDQRYSPFCFKPSLEVVNRKKERAYNDLEAILAVHEAGHVLAGVLYWGVLPKRVSILGRGANRAFAHIIKDRPYDNRESISRMIKTGLGGWAAENLVFGKEALSSGSSGDFKKVTDMAVTYLKQGGLGKGLGNFLGENMSPYQSFEDLNFRIEEEAQSWLKECAEDLKEDFLEYRENLVKIAQEIYHKGEMKVEDFSQMSDMDWKSLKGCKANLVDYLGNLLKSGKQNIYLKLEKNEKLA